MNTAQTKAVAQDKRLQDEARATGEKLMKLRWHWTRDKTNPDRMTGVDYATAVGVNEVNIRGYATGWEILQDSSPGLDLTPDDARKLAKVATDRRDLVIKQAAEAGTSVRNVIEGPRKPNGIKIKTAAEKQEKRDKDVMAALMTIGLALEDRENGVYQPSPEVTLALQFAFPHELEIDWNADLIRLTGKS